MLAVVCLLVTACASQYGHSKPTPAHHPRVPAAHRRASVPNQSRNCFSAPGACGFPDPASHNVGVANCSALTTVTGGDLASVLPRGSYYYSGSGNLLEVVGSHVTWQNLNFADWQIYAGAGNGNLTLNHDCVSFSGTGNAQQYIINEAVGDTGMTIENSTIFSTNPTNLSANGIAAGVGALLDNDYIYNTTDSVSLGNGSTIENSYVISNANAQGAHTEPLLYGGRERDHQPQHVAQPTDSDPRRYFAASSSSSCDNHLTVTNNLLAGGGYVIYACSGIGGIGSSTLTFTGNDFARCGGTFHHGSDGGSYCGSTDRRHQGPRPATAPTRTDIGPWAVILGLSPTRTAPGPDRRGPTTIGTTRASVRCGTRRARRAEPRRPGAL